MMIIWECIIRNRKIRRVSFSAGNSGISDTRAFLPPLIHERWPVMKRRALNRSILQKFLFFSISYDWLGRVTKDFSTNKGKKYRTRRKSSMKYRWNAYYRRLLQVGRRDSLIESSRVLNSELALPCYDFLIESSKFCFAVCIAESN